MLTVAGFTREEVEITAQQDLLVAGRKDDKSLQGDFLHTGIAHRSIERRFELADFVLVQEAWLSAAEGGPRPTGRGAFSLPACRPAGTVEG
ncbi:Hsp20 family protein [Sphingomonas sp.]|uniref:Hsp20 family protein n=1 Tax=Sphingomonas sp. TaxID=28214 RepID=UPI003B00396E